MVSGHTASDRVNMFILRIVGGGGKAQMIRRKNHVCPVERAGSLDGRLRQWIHRPEKILRPYVKEGMTTLDLGCGPGFFTVAMAHMVGAQGRVIAADLQKGMLDRLKNKVSATALEHRVVFHLCERETIGVSESVDFTLAFYVVHEIPDQSAFFGELASIMQPGGYALVVEPPLHVSGSAFDEMIRIAGGAGFSSSEGPKIFFGKSVILKNL